LFSDIILPRETTCGQSPFNSISIPFIFYFDILFFTHLACLSGLPLL
jgi:hypothetical protein